MMGYLVASGVTLAALAGLLVAEKKEHQGAIWVLKPLTSTGFLAAAWLAGAMESSYGQAVFAALVLSWWGDVLLIPRDRPKVFLMGVGAFLLGHVAFAGAFLIRGVAWAPVAGTMVALAVIAAVVLRWLWPHVEAAMKGPVVAYVVVISTMVALAVGTFLHAGKPLILVGALMFYLSDLSVARDRFVQRGFINRVWGLPAYFISQLIFGATV